MSTSIERRVVRLESAAGSRHEPTVFVCLNNPDETTEEAVTRYRAARPDTSGRARFIVVDTGVYRAPMVAPAGRKSMLAPLNAILRPCASQ